MRIASAGVIGTDDPLRTTASAPADCTMNVRISMQPRRFPAASIDDRPRPPPAVAARHVTAPLGLVTGWPLMLTMTSPT